AGPRAAEELEAAVRLAPGLARVEDGNGGGAVRAEVARVPRARIREPDDPQVRRPGEIRRVDVGVSSGPYRRDRAERGGLEQFAGQRADSRLADAPLRSPNCHRQRP